MHEYSIVEALLARVGDEARAHGAHKVHRLMVSIGELSGVDARLFETAFATFRERSVCAEAELCVRSVAAEWRCPRCETKILPGRALRCEACDMPARLASGDEIILDRIEMEVTHV